jgi:hypothetical protein
MNKIVTSFALAFVLLSIVGAIFDGGGIASTNLVGAITSASVAPISVTSTTGFLSSGVIFIGNEKLLYTGKDATHFNGAITRGYETTTASNHASNSAVYSEDVGVVNAALGYDPAAIATSNGYFSAVLIPWDFFTITMPKLLLWDFGLFTGDLAMLRTILIAISMCFYIVFAIQLGQTIAYALRR